MIQTMKQLVDPKTRSATAFYCLLGIAGWDVLTRGFNRYNAALFAAMAVPGLIGALAHAIGAGDDPPPAGPPT